MKDYKAGILSFLIVLFLMPLGHTLMILTEKIFESNKFYTAFGIGFLGCLLLVMGAIKNKQTAFASILGLLSGVLIWTGWVEFSFVWVAEKLAIPPLMENNEVVTKPEYLIMVSSMGVLVCMLLFFMFSPSRCQFFVWIQKILGFQQNIKNNITTKLNVTTVFVETIILLWTFYIVLLLLYDEKLLGDKHFITQLSAVFFLLWSVYLFRKLLFIKKFDYAVRYAIPTVIIFWNVVEIVGRWNLIQEIWVHPFEYWLFNGLLFLSLLGLLSYYIFKNLNFKRY